MSDILEQIVDLKLEASLAWLSNFKVSSRSILAKSQWPTKKTEDWKYTNLKPVVSGEYFFSDPTVNGKNDFEALKKCYSISDLNSYSIVFINGVYSSELSFLNDLPTGVECVRFVDATASQIDTITAYLDSQVDNQKHLFSNINTHFLKDGVFVRVAKNTHFTKPLQIVWLTTHGGLAFHVSQRLLVVAEENAHFSLIEQFVSDDGQQNCLTSGVTELYLAESANIIHYRLHQETQDALHIGGFHAQLKRSASLESFHMALGGKLKRVDVVINQEGEGAHCKLNGVYLPQQDQHVDYHTCIEHRTPMGTTSESFRGIIGGNGRAVFNGRIHIHKDAQKTLAELSNKNLLTSDKAEVDSKPELEIYADDVKCAHGTTVAQLDEAALHYFKTRGIGAKEAEVMLSFGFIKELINEVHHPELVSYLTPMAAAIFAKDYPAVSK